MVGWVTERVTVGGPLAGAEGEGSKVGGKAGGKGGGKGGGLVPGSRRRDFSSQGRAGHYVCRLQV